MSWWKKTIKGASERELEQAAELRILKKENELLKKADPERQMISLESDALQRRLQILRQFQITTSKMEKANAVPAESPPERGPVPSGNSSGDIKLDNVLNGLKSLKKYWKFIPKEFKETILGLGGAFNVNIQAIMDGDPDELKKVADMLAKSKGGDEQGNNDDIQAMIDSEVGQ